MMDDIPADLFDEQIQIPVTVAACGVGHEEEGQWPTAR